ncbi:hypothetical protein ACE198_13785 [Neobacillus sp. KR4-4]|uniref:hypothetical protein n=1 Tax=Neobacillus sp. KR4-4 TaxID=3344872 RepID=UPI0035CC5DDB
MYYIILHHYHPWYQSIVVPFIPPPPVPPVAVTYRKMLNGFLHSKNTGLLNYQNLQLSSKWNR